MTIDEMIAVLQAAKAGKTIQQIRPDDGRVLDYDIRGALANLHLRVKPEPRVIYMVTQSDGRLGAYWYLDKESATNNCAGKPVRFIEDIS